MKYLLLPLMIASLVSGCSKHERFAALATDMTPAQEKRSPSSIAYEHLLSIDTEEQKVAAVFEAAQAACREAADELCTVLAARISSGRAASASLKFRARPGGIKKLVTAVSKQGEVTDQATTAEDLAAPIADAEKKLAMLKDYRSRLEALRGRAGNDVDALIKINRELAQAQSEIEVSEGDRAHLAQRVETEILNVSIGSFEHRSFWKPIGLAISDFGGDLSHGISFAIGAIAYLIPWVLLLGIAVWGGRKLWRRRKDARARA